MGRAGDFLVLGIAVAGLAVLPRVWRAMAGDRGARRLLATGVVLAAVAVAVDSVDPERWTADLERFQQTQEEIIEMASGLSLLGAVSLFLLGRLDPSVQPVPDDRMTGRSPWTRMTDRSAATAQGRVGAGGLADTDLVERARTGDRQAYAALLHRHDAALRRVAFRLLGDAHAMDDALQEAYIKAWRALPGYRGGTEVTAWLYRITYNACMDELRRSRRAPVLLGEHAEPASRSADRSRR